MKLSASLNKYLSVIFMKHVSYVFFGALGLLLIVDVMELSRRSGDLEVPLGIIAAISAMRLPALSEQIVPFAVLTGSLMTLVSLSRRSELVVARASGLSAWQFLVPLLGVAFVIGMIATAIYNPLSAQMKVRSDAVMTQWFAGSTTNVDPDREVWFRQAQDGATALVRAASADHDGGALNTVSAFVFGSDGHLQQRIDAPRAELRDGVWYMNDAAVTGVDGVTSNVPMAELQTPLSRDDVLGRFTPATSVPIWSLPGLVEKAQRAGITADRYLFQFQALLARPMLLMAMVLVAATVSLRFSRHGGTTRLVAAGLSAGFIVFVVNEIAGDLGGAGLVSPILAAWAPPIAASLFGITALLHLEDG
ncbi:MAG: LPS export ABC transporter permease LptG [Pseudomonadota bacterium]